MGHLSIKRAPFHPVNFCFIKGRLSKAVRTWYCLLMLTSGVGVPHPHCVHHPFTATTPWQVGQCEDGAAKFVSPDSPQCCIPMHLLDDMVVPCRKPAIKFRGHPPYPTQPNSLSTCAFMFSSRWHQAYQHTTSQALDHHLSNQYLPMPRNPRQGHPSLQQHLSAQHPPKHCLLTIWQDWTTWHGCYQAPSHYKCKVAASVPVIPHVEHVQQWLPLSCQPSNPHLCWRQWPGPS